MPNIRIDGIPLETPPEWTVLEAAQFLGLEIPTLCHMDGLTPWGGCRLCVVEVGEGPAAKLFSSCTYPVQEGLRIKTASQRVIKARKVLLELMVASVPTSKIIQDLAAKHGVNKVRFKPDWENCIYCGRCVRMCTEQMVAQAIGYEGRGKDLRITTPFHLASDVCRRCGGCIYVCPACTARCEGMQPQHVLCGRCFNSLQPTCLDVHGHFSCWMGLAGDCGTCVPKNT